MRREHFEKVQPRKAPDLQGTVESGAQQAVSAGEYRESGDGRFVRVAGLEQGIELGFFAALQLPDADPAVGACRDDLVSIRGEFHAELFADRLLESVKTLAVAHAPNLDRLVGAGACEQLSIRAECQREDRAVVSKQTSPLLSGCRIPEDDFGVVAPRGQSPSIWRPAYGVHQVPVRPFKERRGRGTRDIPALYGTADCSDPCRGRQPFPIG